MKMVTPQKAPEVKKPVLASLFFRHTRGTPFYTGNLRKVDFTAQEFEDGSMKSAPRQVVITSGEHGTSVSSLRTNGKQADLEDGRLFSLTGVKHCTVKPFGESLAKWAKSIGTLHTVSLKAGPMKGTHEGYILGSMEKMTVGFISKDGKRVWSLDTRSLGKRNENHFFTLVK